MNRILLKSVMVTTISFAAAFAPVAASAQTTGAGFGQHVRHCAQTMGFSGTHNPGMHHGFAGWDGAPCQP